MTRALPTQREALYEFLKSRDNFDKLISDSTTNKGDLAAHYDLSPERYRYFVNGQRKFLIYDTDFSEPTLIDNTDDYTIDIGIGDNAKLLTAERWRYPVGYVISASWAETLSQELQTGDLYVRGLGDPDIENIDQGEDDLRPSADGWFAINTPEMGNKEVKIAIYRDGTEQASDTTSVDVAIDSKNKSRYEFRFDWYNVGSVEFRETYTDNGKQVNKTQTEVGVDEDDGPKTGNKRVVHAVKKENSGLQVAVGSFGIIDLGDVSPIIKEKTSEKRLTYNIGDTNGSIGDWIPVAAISEDEDQEVVNAQLASIGIVNRSDTGADIQLCAVAIDELNTDASGFSTPGLHAERNSVITDTTNISSVPDPANSDQDTITPTDHIVSTGNGGEDNLPGWQIGYASAWSSGQGTNTERSGSTRVKKRNIYPEDAIVIMARSDSAGVSFNIEYVTEQQW